MKETFVVEVESLAGEFTGRTAALLARLPREVVAVEYERDRLRFFLDGEGRIPVALTSLFPGRDLVAKRHEK